MSTLQAVVLAIVEGLTEFVPVSSTGHLIMVSSLMAIGKDEFTQFFEVAVQMGAVLAVVVLYARKFFNFRHWTFYVKLIIGVIPIAVIGYKFEGTISKLLISPFYTAVTLLAGGFVLLFIDNVFRHPRAKTERDITYLNSLIIGLFQCIALIPGISRSAATIIGGMHQKLTRSLAAEFSFFLAVPTMIGATGLKLYKIVQTDKSILHNAANIKALAIGEVVAFIVAFFTMNFFVNFIKKHGFKFFGWYRIIIAIVFFLMIKLNQIR
jgi:undecaprenyl-diphosphatase